MGQKTNNKKSLEAIKNFLQSEGIQLPKNFDKKITEAAEKFCGGRLPGISAIENVLKCCKYWKKYCISKEDYEKLVCNECYKMARLQCSVISTHEDATSFVGESCKVNKECLPECTTTVANSKRAVVYEGMGAAEKVFSPLH